jgi:hypothetical protein
VASKKITPTTMRFPPDLKKRLARVVQVANERPEKVSAGIPRGRISASSLVIHWTEEGVAGLERALGVVKENGGKNGKGGALD